MSNNNSAEKIENLSVGKVVGNRFKILSKLGEGGCGSVYKVEDLDKKDKVLHAMKVEFQSGTTGSILKMEVNILQHMENKKHVAKLITSGKRKGYSYMVMTLLGRSLCSLVSKYGPYLNVSTQTRIGMCLIFGIKQLHDVGYIHRDLKPANIAMGYSGTQDERMFLILDFGLARQFVMESGKGKEVVLRRPRERTYFRGTTRYCSLAMHDHLDQGRVDDLWTILYILAELRYRLPWNELLDKNDVAEMKRKTPDGVLLAKSPVQLLEFAEYIRQLNYYDRPEYDKIYKIFGEVMKQGGYKWSDPYHWEKVTEKKNNKSAEKKTKSAENKSPGSGSANLISDPEHSYLTLEDFTSNELGF